MGYRQHGSVAELASDRPVETAARRTVRRVGELLHERVTFHTPVAKPAPDVPHATFLSERERRPGTLRDSWRIGSLTLSDAEGATYSIEVYTEDPVAPHVEYMTAPHEIRPRLPNGMLRFRGRDGEVIYARVVHHPGTRGAYMMATAITEVAAEWERIGVEELDVAFAEHMRAVSA